MVWAGCWTNSGMVVDFGFRRHFNNEPNRQRSLGGIGIKSLKRNCDTCCNFRISEWKKTRVVFQACRCALYDDVVKWKHFPRYWPFVRGIHRSPVNSPHKGQWRGALMFSLICTWINGWVNNGEAGDLRRHRVHYDVTIMVCRDHRYDFESNLISYMSVICIGFSSQRICD